MANVSLGGVRVRCWSGLVAGVLVAALAGCSSGSSGSSGLRTVFMGDSITIADTSDRDGVPGRESWVRYVVTDPRSPWALEHNAAVIGETLPEMAARFSADVLARDPEAVVVMGGTNDWFAGVPRTESLAALESMVVAASDAGAQVWVVGPPPMGSEGGWRGFVDSQERLARRLGVPFLRTDAAVSDPDTGGWAPGATDDGVHPTASGARAMGDAVLEQLGGVPFPG